MFNLIHLIRHCLQKAGETLIQDGVLPLLWRMAVKCASPFGTLGIVNLYEKDLSLPLVEVRGRACVSIRVATRADIESLTMLRLLDQDALAAKRYPTFGQDTRAQIAERFHLGWKCYVATAGGKIVHCTWLALRWAESMGHRFILLKNDEAYTADAYTAKAWRSKGLHRMVKHRILTDLQKENYRTAYVLVHADCRPSKWVQVLLGYKNLGTVLYFDSPRAQKTWTLLIRGTSAPFLEDKIPFGREVDLPEFSSTY